MIQYRFYCLVFILISPVIFALPKTNISFNRDAEGFMRAQIKNETLEQLACYVAIDGYKRKFQLRPRSTSRWFTATDKRFDYTAFKTWCDYLELHPQYQKYQAY